MKCPQISEELIEFLHARYCTESFNRSDTPDVMRWKAAQRALVEELNVIHQQQKGGGVEVKGFKIRSDD